jgi:hypothetical protein
LLDRPLTQGLLGRQFVGVFTPQQTKVFGQDGEFGTIGGGGVLWLVDLGLLIAVKDLSPFKNNPNVFMWNNAH